MKKSVSVLAVLLCLTASGASPKKAPLYKDPSQPVEKRVEDLLSRMTLEEKILQVTQSGIDGNLDEGTGEFTVSEKYLGVGSVLKGSNLNVRNAFQRKLVEETRLGIPTLYCYDVIHGYKTTFPIPLAQAATFNPELTRRACEVQAMEAAADGIHLTFSPMVDVARDPRWGRCAEGFGEDPYLSACFAEAAVRGYQGDDYGSPDHVAACLKHYVGYGASEAARDYVQSDFSRQSLWETYLPPFEAGVKAGAASVMSGFNTVDQIPASANHYTITEVLKQRWGFDGMVVSDWGAVEQLVPQGMAPDKKMAGAFAINAGVDLCMGDGVYYDHMKALVEEGLVKESTLDEAVRRILRLKFRCGLFEHPYTEDRGNLNYLPESMELCEEVGQQSIVLLKNSGNILPLKGEEKIFVFGPKLDADGDMRGCWAGRGDNDKVVTIREAMLKEFGADRIFFPNVERKLYVEMADGGHTVVICLGEYARWTGEGSMKTDLSLGADQEKMVRDIKSMGNKVIVLISNGRALDLTEIEPWADAIVEMWQPGMMAGPAVAGVLSGRYNPSGKLPVTFPFTTGQIPIYYGKRNPARQSGYYMDIPAKPLYEFGYGLSYSTFEYSDISFVSPLKVQVTVTNTSDVDGMETVLWYISDPYCTIPRPVKELRHFEKRLIKAGASEVFTYEIDPDSDLGYVDAGGRRFLEHGKFYVRTADKSAEFDY